MEAILTEANFIWHRTPAVPNEICVFRREFSLDVLPQHAEAIVAAETRYYLWLNGKQLVFEGGLLRESAPGCGWADKIDLTSCLRLGSNLLVIWVYYYGNGGRNNTRLSSGGLFFSCPELGIQSDEQFLCRVHPAFYTPGEPKPSYLYGGDNLGYDARLDTDPAFQSAEGFSPAVILDRKIFGGLYPRPIPQTRAEEELPLPDISYADGEYIAKLPYAMTMLPVLLVTAKGGEKIFVCTDRWEVPGGPGDEMHLYHGHRLEFICKPGENRLESLIAIFGESIRIRTEPTVQIRTIACRNTGYDTDITGSFRCSEPLLNQLVQKATRTLYVCMRDNFMDCPDRERGQWIGDVSVQVPQAAFLLDSRAMLLVRKAIHDFITLRKGDTLVGNVPGENFSELPCQSLTAISEWGLVAQYWKYTADRDTLRLVFEPAVRYLQLWEVGSNGLILPRRGNWPWFDHLYNCDEPVIENAWYLSALRFLKKAAEILGDHSADAFLNERISSISAGFEEYFWKKDHYASDERIVDDRANALAVLSGACPPQRYPQIRRILLSTFNSTVYMENFVLTALCEMGYFSDAKNRMLSRYYNLAVNENSTLWEDFFLLGTKNHAWSGAPATIAFRYFMGIDIEASENKLEVHPCWDLFPHMECSFQYNGQWIRIEADSSTRNLSINKADLPSD
ncbi:MAG: hypothetical protein ACOX6P_04300 [Candidatus Merdivicinus sp.]